MDKTWKSFERRVAKRTGGERIPVADRRSHLDVLHPYLGIECKYREKLSQYIKDWYKQAEDGSKDGQVPVVAIGEKNSSRIFALLDFDDLIMLLVHAVDGEAECRFGEPCSETQAFGKRFRAFDLYVGSKLLLSRWASSSN